MAANTYVVATSSVGQPVIIPGSVAVYAGAPPTAPGPQWDPTRNAYVQWDAATGTYRTWDPQSQTWK